MRALPIQNICEEAYPPAAANLIDHIDGVEGRFHRADLEQAAGRLSQQYSEAIQMIYMDPPFYTGQSFSFVQPVGERGYGGDKAYRLTHTAYRDPAADRDVYLAHMGRVFRAAYEMLAPSGSLYLHVDYRAAAYLKLLLDDIFGEDNFLNEIIWHYRSGGRSVHHFSRKHDTIFLYRKSSDFYFDIESVGQERGDTPRNHMKRQVDENGRVYFSIRSGGKEYRYYADEKIYPSDVWDDISHLQQRDPERTGYDTQKPKDLLERIISVSSRPGDTVADLFAGSGTTLAAAQGLKRRYVGVDRSPYSLAVARRRLIPNSLGMVCLKDTLRDGTGAPWLCDVTATHAHQKIQVGIKALTASECPEDDLPAGIPKWEHIDGWAAGRVDGECFYPLKWAMRSAEKPALPRTLSIPAETRSGLPLGIALYDVWGRASYFTMEQPEDAGE